MNELQQGKHLNPLELKPALDITLVEDEQGLEVALKYLKSINILAFDTETNMTDDHTHRCIRTIQLGDKNKQFVIDVLPFAKRAGLTIEQAFTETYKPHKCMQPIIDLLTPILDSDKYIKIGHNLQFDYQVIKYNLGIRMWNLYDTLLAEKAIYAGRVRFTLSGFWALDDLVLRYTGLIISKTEQTSFDLTSALNKKQITYCALDCRLPFAIKAGQTEFLNKGNLWRICTIENNAVPAFGDMFLNGITVNKKRWVRNVFEAKKAHKLHIAKLDQFFIPLVGRKTLETSDLLELEANWRNEKDKELRAINRKQYMARKKLYTFNRKNYKSFEGQAAINYASPVVLFKIMKEFPHLKEQGRFKDTNDRTLKAFSEHPNWDWNKVKEIDPLYNQVGMLDALRLYRETSKLLTSFGLNWLRENINKTTNKVHANFIQYGADTGRTSCSKPNMQQIPKGSLWRSCFTASDEEHLLITMDMNGAELRIAAECSREMVFINAFAKGWDVHSVGAEIVFGKEWKDGTVQDKCAYYFKDKNGVDHKKCKCLIHKELRDRIKAVNFGIFYGMEYKKLAEETGMTEDQAKETLDRYRKSFPTLIAYLEKSGELAKDTLESRTLCQRRRLYHAPKYKEAIVIATKKNKKYKQPNPPTQKQINQCFRSMFEAIEREGKNTPIQGTNADIAKIVMGSGSTKDGFKLMWHQLHLIGAKLVLFVHDEFVVETLRIKQDETENTMRECNVKGAAEVLISVQMDVEANKSFEWSK